MSRARVTRGEQQIQDAVLDHIAAEWPERHAESFVWELGPLQQAMPHVRVIRVPPPADQPGYWRYLTAGSWFGTRDEDHGHEFILHSRAERLCTSNCSHSSPTRTQIRIIV